MKSLQKRKTGSVAVAKKNAPKKWSERTSVTTAELVFNRVFHKQDEAISKDIEIFELQKAS